MALHEYKVIPAPTKGERARGVRGHEARFALTLQSVMNDQAAGGWEYLRADTLPCDERRGLLGRVAVDQHVLVFRRAIQSPSGALLMSDPILAGASVRTDTPPLRAAAPEREAAPAVRLGVAARHPQKDAAAD